MKAITSQLLEKMLGYAEIWMANEQWSPDEIMVFKSDPVVRLLYGACAEEIGNVHEEIFHVKQRLIHETIEKLLPDEFHAPAPAHAILSARPLEKAGESKIGIDTQVILRKPENLIKDFVFTPAGFFTLSQADVKYLVFRDSLYLVEGEKRERTITPNASARLQSDVLWMGIRDLSRYLPKERLTLFFHLPQATGDLHAFFNSLKYCRCYAGDQLLTASPGLTSDENETRKRMLRQRRSFNLSPVSEGSAPAVAEETDYREKLLTEPDFMIYKLIRNVREWYHKQYLTLYDLPRRLAGSPAVPEEIGKLFPEKEQELAREDIYWLKFSFGNLLDERWISQLFCSMNCFPALNLRLEKTDYNVESMPVNIFPVSGDDPVLCLNSVTGKVMNRPEETEYRMLEANPGRTVAREGDAIFRKGGLGRQDPRKLKNMLNLMANLLKEETILLTKNGTRDDLNKLNRLTRALNDFEGSLESERSQKVKHTGSVILRPYKYHSKIFIRFWTTAAEEANQIRPGRGADAEKQCELVFGPEIKPDSLRLITTTGGGRKKPTEEEHIDTVRKLLLTRGRIVTAEDIKAFCYEHLSGYKVTVEVKKSVGQSRTPGHGLVRTIEVMIRFREKPSLREEELTLLKEELLLRLEQNSATVMPFIITFA
ncbi:MAG TPA: hypothetical protein PKN44_10500 [Bacteroidales bacterium]|nr:hypothetical protein [Bacteroidales bacterium]HPS63693.1 hypothetical protein [Bacteroidales bacterium]